MINLLLKKLLKVITGSAQDWSNDNIPMLSAAISYYTLFSLAPLLIIAIAAVGLIFGGAAVQNEIYMQMKGLVGSEGARTIQDLILSASNPVKSIGATIFSAIVLLFGASGVFGQLQAALNTVWHVPPKPTNSVWDFIVNHLFSFAMIGGVSFLLLVSLLIDAFFAVTGKFFSRFLPESAAIIVFINQFFSTGIITLLFATLFKTLPNANVRWRDVWVGALVTTGLFLGGKYLIGLYLGSSAIGTTFGTAASLVIVLIWTYYSAQILLFGAEFTKWYAIYFGSRITTAKTN
jgi:membrane protein